MGEPGTGRIVIFSDTHLGREHCAAIGAAALRPLWDGASNLIINGDVAEIHHPAHWSVAARQTLELFDSAEADDVTLTLLSGNHDPYISDIRHLQLADGQVFITHGDVLHPAVAPWSPAAGRIRRAFDAAMAALEPTERGDLEKRLDAARHASHAEWHDLSVEAERSTLSAMLLRPWAIVQVLWYWHMFPKLAERFVATHVPSARFAIFGHTHHPGVWRIAERVIINTGSFGFPGSPRAVVLEDNQLSVWPIELRGDVYRFGSRPLHRFDGICAAQSATRPSAPKTRPGSALPSSPET